ncbi:MAG: MarR family transcriptional regulator [Labilithrix sp.]|nr:MarR family transcriptional regulator [Labilithrix sp.]
MQSADTDETAVVVDCLRRLVHSLRVSSHTAERDLGVTGAQLFVLRELAAEPGVSIRRLSERTLTDASSVSVVVARLVENGLVIRRSDEHDARRSVLVVSRRGKTLLARAPAPYQEQLIAALREMPSQRVRSLGRMLSELVETLEPARGSAPLFFEESPKKRARSRRG